MKVYFSGCSRIQAPVDFNGNEINEGTKLTWDFHDDFYKGISIPDWMIEPIYIVKKHPSGKGFYAEGIDKNLYLHDFRFKFCEVAS